VASSKYPLEQVLSVKKDRVDKAERVVEEKQRALEVEQAKLKKVEAMRDEVKNHKADKINQLDEAFKKGTTSDEILQAKAYLKVVDEKLAQEEKKVAGQKEQVIAAERKLKEAQADLSQKRKDEEKIALHKEHWEKEMMLELSKKEALEQDEIGQLMHQAHQKRREAQ
jgi:flagellar biosynthesis chaperone FliJ